MSSFAVKAPGDTWSGGGDHEGHTITAGDVAVETDEDGWGRDIVLCICNCGEEWWALNE